MLTLAHLHYEHVARSILRTPVFLCVWVADCNYHVQFWKGWSQ